MTNDVDSQLPPRVMHDISPQYTLDVTIQSLGREVESHTGRSRNGERSHGVSVMREYLDGEEFYFPGGIKHLVVPNHEEPPLANVVHKSDPLKHIIFYATGASTMVSSFRAIQQNPFKRLFAVKTFINKEQKMNNRKALKEIENMTPLYHPHVSALLGSYTQEGRFHILVFPLACCNLFDFMIHICGKMEREKRRQEPTRSDSDSSNSSHSLDSANALTQSAVFGQQYELTRDNWNRLHLDLYLSRLQAFFFCLCKALEYIHLQDIRHKDIKPQNVLVDSSLSPILADFGLSAQFPRGASHVTHDGPPGTREYTAPETVISRNGHHADHDDPSDVFSLGCLFLEVATVSLGKNLTAFKNTRADPQFYSENLAYVNVWIRDLRIDGQKGVMPFEQVFVAPGSREAVLQVLPTIQRMLRKAPKERPKSKELAASFSNVSSWICPDCRGKTPWAPSEKQKQAQDRQRLPKKQSQDSGPPTPLRDGRSLLAPRGVANGLLSADAAFKTGRRSVSIAPSISSTSSEMAETAKTLRMIPADRRPKAKPKDRVYVYRFQPPLHGVVDFQQIQG